MGVFSSQVPYNSPDGLLPRFDAPGQPELDERPCQVVLRVFYLEVDVSFQVVGKEAQSQFEGDQPDRVVDVEEIVFSEKIFCNLEVAPQDGPAEVEVEAYLTGAFGLFSQRVAAGAEAIADIVVDQPRAFTVSRSMMLTARPVSVSIMILLTFGSP